jgi:beta-glucosidase-like glycosyl hydrolase
MMTLEQKIGQFFFPAVFINDTEENIQATEALIRKHNIGGLTFFHSRASAATNYESKQKVVSYDDSYSKLKELITRYQKCATTPLLMSIDAEWGLAMRIEKTPQYPYAITLGALPETEIGLVYEVGKQIGLDLKAAGIQYNLAPLADINNNPDNPVIGYRSFGQNKEKVALFANAYLKGMSDAGILGCLKHFPGHGNTNVDSHLGLPILNENLEQLMANELYPFIKGIENKVDSIMIGHLAVPALNEGHNTSATLSKNIIIDLLRNQLGFEGLVISDALNMKSVSDLYQIKGQLEWEAFNAGNDVLCFTDNVVEGIQEILINATPERIEASFNRLWKCKEKAGIVSGQNIFPKLSNTTFDCSKSDDLNRKIAQNCITKVKKDTMQSRVLESAKDKKLALLSIYKTNATFIKKLSNTLQSPVFEIELEKPIEFKEVINQCETLLISLFVPKAKPLNNFDIEPEILKYLNELLCTKNCVLYVFGNPYALQVISNLNYAKEIVVVYQDFDAFQEVAAENLLKNTKLAGVLPVKIRNL